MFNGIIIFICFQKNSGYNFFFFNTNEKSIKHNKYVKIIGLDDMG